jgi:phosphoglycerate dehydrogenase-like enzyme/ASC-1-like (ASCH) protein
MRTKTLWIKEEYLQQIRDGRKTIEVRVGYGNISRLQAGDHLMLNDEDHYIIRRIGRYANFEAMLEQENPAAIAPDTPPAELLGQIRAIYPREKEELGVITLEIAPAAALNVHLLYQYDPEDVANLQDQLLPGISLSVSKEIGEEADYHVLVAGRPTRHHLTSSPNLHTVIIPWVGIAPETRALLAEFPHVAVHNLHHNAAPTAELAIALLLAAVKLIIPYDSKLRQHDWTMRYNRPGPSLLLEGKTALILGYGAIGRRVAATCRGMGMTTLAIKRQVEQPSDQIANEIYAVEALHALLPRADVLLICLPLTPETENLIGAQELALLPVNSVLVNIGRGRIVDQGALYTALRDGRLHSAGIDVWYNYPPDKDSRAQTPPADYPFHELENVVMSPHRGGDTYETERLRMSHLSRLLNRIIEEKPVPNSVDLEKGY